METMKKVAKAEVKQHEKRMHGAKMAKGGVTGKAMRAVGRNKARGNKQRSK